MAGPHPNPYPNGETGGSTPRRRPPTPTWVWALGIAAIVVVVVVVIVLVAGIGGEHGPGRHSPSGGASNLPVTERVASDVGGPASANEAARVVEVDAFEVAFRPSRVSVAAGETVTFVVTNTGRTVHEFTIGDAAMQQEHAEMTTHMSGAMPHDLPNSISLQPGEAKRITWRFGNAGTLEFACHVPGHYEAGMRGQITVN